MIVREVGVDPSKINYVAFRGGGEAISAILGGNVTVGGSGFSESRREYISTGKMKPIGVTSGQRLKGVDVPTLKEQETTSRSAIGAACTAPHITKPQRDALVAMLEKATKSKALGRGSQKNDWTPAWLASDAFGEFVDQSS
ncbi:GDNF family receptor alpha-3 [Manis javanica]|nr:GDNF family receptor alpha-3 [Manis javanica]